MKPKVQFLCLLFCIVSALSCKSKIELYTNPEGCVVSDDTRNIKLFGAIDTSFLLTKRHITWEMIYLVKDGFFRDEVYKLDSFQSILIADSSAIISHYISNYLWHLDSVHLLNIVINKKFVNETILQGKPFEVATNRGELELRLIFLEYPIAILHSKRKKEYYIFKANAELKK